MRRPFSTLQRWPFVIARAPEPRALLPRVLVVAAAVVAAGAAIGLGQRAPLALRGAVALAGLLPLAWAVLRRRPAARATGAFVESNDVGLSRVTPDGTKPIVTWDAPFGVALLASYGRPFALLAFTTPTQTRYVPVRVDGRSEDDDELLARIAVLADLDLVDGVAHDAALTAASAAALLRYVEHRDGAALGRAYLSDGRGTPIALERATLVVGERAFDLTSGLEWRPLMFHESTGQAAALYQATWIRQQEAEIVLVAPMPASIVPRDAAAKEATGRLGRALTRDLRLLQAPSESPPAREVRVAIDRPFMMAVRRALADAPLAARVVVEQAPRRGAERRGSVA